MVEEEVEGGAVEDLIMVEVVEEKEEGGEVEEEEQGLEEVQAMAALQVTQEVEEEEEGTVEGEEGMVVEEEGEEGVGMVEVGGITGQVEAVKGAEVEEVT